MTSDTLVATETVYIADTVILIDLYRRRYPPDTFPTLWSNLDTLATDGRLLVHEEVFEELSRYDDGLVQWLRERPSIIKDIDEAQCEMLKQVLQRTPAIVEINKQTAQADPFIIALALVETQHEQISLFPRRVAVLTHERNNSTPKKIPYVCQHFGIPCFTLIDLFAMEGWTF